MSQSLIDQFGDWLDQHDTLDVSTVSGHAQTFLDWHGHTALATVDEHAIRAFLLDWCPRHLNMPADVSWEVVNGLVEFLMFLGFTGRLQGGQARGRTLARVANGLVEPMQARMVDPANYGFAKQLFAGIDAADTMTEEELLAAIQRRVDEHNALPLEQRRAVTDQLFESSPASELPFVHIPPSEAEVAQAAAAATLPKMIEALRDYLGERGRVLTAKGNLKLADGRALVQLLDTGDELDPRIGDKTFRTHSTSTLPGLGYLLIVAEGAGAVRHRDGRLVPVKAWSRKTAIARASDTFRVVAEFGALSATHRAVGFYGEIHALLDEGVVHWLAGLLAPGSSARVSDILELNQQVIRSQFDNRTVDFYLSGMGLVHDLSRLLDRLRMTGAIDWADRVESLDAFGTRFWTGGTIALTAFGCHVLPSYLPAAHITLRGLDDLADADLTDLLSAMDEHAPEEHSMMLAAWKPSLPASQRAGLVSAMVAGANDAETRLVGLRLLQMFDLDVAETHMRQLLDTPAAGHAAVWLLDHGLADGDAVGGFITPAMMVDILAMLVNKPEVLCEQFLRSHDPGGMLEAFWRHPAPETAPVLDTLGRFLPDRALAKEARKAAMRHRSWIAGRADR